MKQIFACSILSLFLSFNLMAQTDAPDFTVTDIYGNEHNLHAILDSNLVVVLDCSATWCPPCWSFHQGKFLNDINDKYGPEGTNQVRVIFYEADANTTDADLNGTGGNTQGDWVEGSNYPIVNESPVQLSGSVYWPLGFPTINVIRPSDKKIIGDLYDPWAANEGLPGMEEMIESAFGGTTNTSSSAEIAITVYPNPVESELVIDITLVEQEVSSIQVYNVQGHLIRSIETNSSKIKVDVADWVAGQYILNFMDQEELIGSKKITKN